MNKIYFKFSKSLVLAVILAGALMVGCSGGSNDPVSSAISTEPGYKIQLAAAPGTVSVGGQAVITAKIYEPDGSPIRDNEPIIFASSEGGTFSDSDVTTKNGQAMVSYTAGDTPMRFDNVTASCRGAIATVQIWVLPQAF